MSLSRTQVLCGGFFVIYFIEAAVSKIFNIHSHSHGVPTGGSVSPTTDTTSTTTSASVENGNAWKE